VNLERRSVLARAAALSSAASVSRTQDLPTTPLGIAVPFAAMTAGIEPE
jgi:mannose/fructose/N-acetylgalactosamine-specific phosphotransferase system component IIC